MAGGTRRRRLESPPFAGNRERPPGPTVPAGTADQDPPRPRNVSFRSRRHASGADHRRKPDQDEIPVAGARSGHRRPPAAAKERHLAGAIQGISRAREALLRVARARPNNPTTPAGPDPTLTVIIPTHNRRDQLLRCLSALG